MNIEDFSQINPDSVLTLLVGLVLLTIFLVFILPAILRQEKLRFSITYSFSTIRKNFVLSASLIIIVIAIGAVGYFYYSITRPTIVSVDEFQTAEETSLDEIKKLDSLETYLNSDLLMIDTRDPFDFYQEHIAKSFNMRPNYAENDDITFLDGKRVIVFSTQDNFDEANTVANSIMRRGDAKKVYVLREGYEGLKEAGFDLKRGVGFEEQDL